VLFDVYKALDQVSGDALTTNPSSIRSYSRVCTRFCGNSFHHVWAEVLSWPSVWSKHQGPVGYEMRLLKTCDRSRLVQKKSKFKKGVILYHMNVCFRPIYIVSGSGH